MAWRDRVVGFARVSSALLEPHPLNWRRHPAQQETALRRVLEDVGVAGALVVVAHGDRYMVLDGHLRQSLSEAQEWPCLVLDLSDEEARALLASYDPIGAMAASDSRALDALLGSLAGSGFDDMVQGMHEQTASTSDKGAGPKAEADVSWHEMLREQYGVERGQVWQLGRHVLWCGDCSQLGVREVRREVCRGLDPVLVYTDPPYGVSYQGGMLRHAPLQGDEEDGGDSAWLLYNVLAGCAEVEVCYLWTSDRYCAVSTSMLVEAGFDVHAHLIWVKNHAQFVTAAHYKAKHETCLYATRGDAPWHGGTNEVTLFEIDRAPRNDYHPTQKPVEHAMRCLSNSSLPQGVVLDPFLGGGTTLLAAEEGGQRCIGVEIDPQFVAVCLARWAAWTGQEPALTSKDVYAAK